VEPFGIVAEFDVACHILSRMVSGGIYGAIDPLNFQSSIKRFCERVIVTDAGSADGASNTVAVAIAGKFFGHVLGAYCVQCRLVNDSEAVPHDIRSVAS
jgi:hypothetical protein